MAATNIPAVKSSLAVKFPFVTEDGKEFSDLEKLLADLGQQSGGYFLLGANNCWHGGIHITDEKFAHHKKKHPVCCMMDGTVIAYRLNKNYPTQKWQAKSTQSATDLKFSNGFCLVRHEHESPVNPLTLYSLYMHLADYNTYAPENPNTEKPVLPGYWKSRVIGKSKERMRVYRTEQACKKRTTPHDALLNEQQTVTFDAAQIKSATINGKTLKIALCKIDNAATFAHNTRLNEGWMIVDESQVSWKKVEPTEFDRIVKCNFPIKAGDPIGFMGIWESPADPIGAGATKTKYQMHVELFTTDDKAALDKFLNNEARLTTGKKYLKVPKGSKLYSSDDHGGFVNPHELLNVARDYVFEESACTQVKDPAGTVFYNIKGIRTGDAATGPVDFAHVKIEGGVKLVTQYDWKELGFSTLEESNNDSDGYIDPDKIPSALFNDIFKRVDGINSRNGQGDGILTGKEIKDALQQDKELRNDLYKIIAGHPSEWHSTTQNNMRRLCEKIKAKNTEEEYKNAIQFEIDRFLKCEFVSQIDGLTQKLWHFHPLETIKKLDGKCKYCPSEIYEIETTDGMVAVSKESIDLILAYESYQKFPYVPSDTSGITVGYGYDLSQQTEINIRNDLKNIYSEDDIGKFIDVSGRYYTGNAARTALNIVNGISISKDDAYMLATRTNKRYAQYVVDIYPDSINLHPHCQGALLSLVFNRGNKLTDARNSTK